MSAAWVAFPLVAALAAGADLGPTHNTRLDTWRIIGPGGGGTTRRPAVSPHDPKVVVLGCDMTGGYITTDGGASWRMFNLGAVPTAFAFDPARPQTLYAGADAVYRSDDTGRTWRLVLPDPAQGTEARPISDHGDRVFFTRDPAYPGSGRSVSIHAIAVDEDEPSRVFVAASAADSPIPGTPPSPTVLLRSTDGGSTWSRVTALGSERIFAIRADGGAKAARVYAIGETGMHEGDGKTWRHFPVPDATRFTSGSFGRDPRSGLVFAYATTALSMSKDGVAGGIHVSDDGGRTWRRANGILLDAVRAVGQGDEWGPAHGSRPSLGPVAASSRFPLVAYAGFRGLLLPGRGDAVFNGIAKTTDGGQSWSAVHAESDRPSADLAGSWIEPRAQEDGHSVWFDSPYDLAAAPGDPDVAFATDLFRAYRTLDGGKAWAQVNSERRGEDRWTSRGLDVTTTYGIQFDPHDPRRLFIPYTDIGLFRSEDGGETWTGSTNGIPRDWRNTTYWLAFDPEVKGLVWGGFSGTHDLPRPKMWRRTDPARFKGGVAVSTDGGRNWTVSNQGMEESAITHVLLDPRSPKASRTLYAAAFGRGVYKSTDGGRTWALKNAGLAADPRNQPFAWRLTLAPDGALYLVVARRSERGRIGDADDGALYRSTDGAERWQAVPLPAGTNGPNGLTVDPADPKRLYLSAWGVMRPDGDTGGGIFLSTDAGATWRNVLPTAQHVYDVTVDPRDPSVLYACGFDQAAFRSTDRGQTWARIRGFNFKWGQRVIPDPRDASKIYVTTFGGSVWHGPAAGDPGAAEDVVAPRVAAPSRASARLEQFVEANILGTQAFQVALARKEGKGDPACYSPGALNDADLAALETHQAALLKSETGAVRAWAEGRISTFDPKVDLAPLLASGLRLADTLPVSVFTRWLAGRTQAPRAHVRAIASLFQTNLEVERDGDRLQELFAFYAGLGLPVYLGQLGLPGTDEAFLAMGRELEGQACASPVGTNAPEWQIAARKNWNWGEKNLGIRDDKVLARELLEEPEVKALVPRIRALGPLRVAVIGHSFTMQLHWSTPGAFVPIVTAIFARENPRVQVRQFQGGGLTSTRALERFYADALAWKPDVVLFVVANRTPGDLEAFQKMGRGFAAAGARVYTFDNVGLPGAARPGDPAKDAAAAREAGMTVVEVEALLASAPDRDRFLCLDGIHMTEPYHRLMAREWLKLLVGARGGALAGKQATPTTRNDIPFSTEVATPHVPWATKLPGGPIRGFFVPPVTEGRDMVELMQRLSLAPTTVTIDRNWDVNCWGIGDFYDSEHVLRGDKDDFRIVYGYVEEELLSATPFEVLVIPGLNGWSRYTKKTRDAILRRVSEGAGLVLLHPFVGDVQGHPFLGDEREGDERIWEISPLVGVPDDRVNDRGYPEVNREAVTEGRWRARPHALVEGLDLEMLPSGARGGRFYRYEAKGDVVVEAAGLPVVATRTYGRGRVVAFATVGDGLIPEAVDPVKTRTYWDYWEYQYALLARAVLWAARGEGDVRIRSLTVTPEAGLSLVLSAAGAPTVEVEARARSAYGDDLGTVRRTVALAGGEAHVEIGAADLAAAGWPGGRSVVDVIVRDPATRATLQWGWAGLEVPQPASLSGIRPNASVYREGDTMGLVTRAAGDLQGLVVQVRVADDLGRLRAVEQAPARGERTFFHRLDHVLGRRLAVSARLIDARGRIVDELRHEPIVVAARERRTNDYRALLSFETPVHYLAERRLQLLRKRAMDTSFTWGGEVNDELGMPRGWFGVYWYDRGPTTPEGMEAAIAEFRKADDVESLAYLVKKELFRRTGETRFLARNPSLDDPHVQQRLFDLARGSARAKAVYNMDYYFVGDEGSLGSYADAVDFDWGKHALDAFRSWLQEQYGSLEALNRTWGSAFGEWDAVLPLTTEAARRGGRFAPWADHRTYMEVSFARAYETVRRGVREGDPEGRIALSGTQVTNPWNGCDWHRLDAVIDDFLSYSGGNQWDIHRSFAKPGARIGFWTGYGRRGAAVKHEVWTAALQGVLHPQLFWSPSIVNPDLTFSRSGKDLGEAFQALRFEGIGRLLMEAERLDDGVAVHYSMPSVHAAGILGQHDRDAAKSGQTSFPADRDGWVRLLDDLPLSFRFVAAPQVEEGALRGRRVFVLPYSTALSDREVAEIRRFVEEGGVLLADGAPGLFDEHVAWRESGALDALLGVTAPPPRTRVAVSEGTPTAAGARTRGPVVLTAEGTALGVRAADVAGLEALEPAVHAGEGRALLRVGEADLAVVHRVGRGRTLLLNALLDREGAARDGWREVVRDVLAEAGIRPAVSVTDLAGRPVSRVRVARYRFGDHDVVALLNGQLDVKTSFARDGVTVFEDAEKGRVVRQEVNVALPRVSEVTNARTGEALGRTGRIRVSLTAGEALVLSLGPERPSLSLEGPPGAKRGEATTLTVVASSPERRILRWDVRGPGGAFRPEYAQATVADGSTAAFVLPSALNDEMGEYRIRVTDVLSGASAERRLRLE